MLDPYDELQFIQELSLRNLQRREAGFNFSCPLCNEGKSPHKRRGWILLAGVKYDHNTYMCHNCLPEGISVRKFISLIDPSLFIKYKEFEKKKYIEDIRAGKIHSKKKYINIRPDNELKEKPERIFPFNKKTFIPLDDPKAIKALEYCKKRKIPDSVIKRLLYCPHKKYSFGKMLIFPLWYDDELAYGFQGRSIEGKRFHTFMPNTSYKVYNLFQVDKSATVYVFESIIDSYVTTNSISMLGADLSKPVLKILKKRVFVFDNDRTGEEKTLKYLKNGEKCFIWPNGVKAKDFGELIEKNIDRSVLRKLIKTNIFSGFKGEVEIKMKLSKSKKTFRRQHATI